MNIMAIIPARRGSRGLPGKNVRDLMGQAVLCYSIEDALAAELVDRVVVTTDDAQARDICRDDYSNSVTVIDRPGELADDTARVDDAMRHCCRQMEAQYDYCADIIVLLYANVPVRAEGIIDRAVEHLIKTGADSVQTLAEVGKYHPYWLYQLDGDRAAKYIDNQMYQRQDLPPLYFIDSAVAVVKREALMRAEGSVDPHAFWGKDRRGITQQPHETVDIDTFRDFRIAEAALAERTRSASNV